MRTRSLGDWALGSDGSERPAELVSVPGRRLAKTVSCLSVPRMPDWKPMSAACGAAAALGSVPPVTAATTAAASGAGAVVPAPVGIIAAALLVVAVVVLEPM